MIRQVKTRIARAWASIALLSVEMVVILGLFFAALTAFAWLVRRVFVLEKTEFDARAFEALGGYVNPLNNEVMHFFTFLGTHYFLIPANLVLVGWFLFVRPHKWYSIKVPAIAISSLIIMLLLKEFFGRDRPLIPLLETARGFSFPSGHAFMSTTFYGLLAYLAWQHIPNRVLRLALGTALWLLILIIGLSRIYLRVHYTSDVLAGLSLGIVWLMISLTAIRQIELWSKRSVTVVEPVTIRQD